MLEHMISKEPLMRTCVSSAFPSEKLLPRKRVLPIGTARSIICEKIVLREITVEAIPMTVGVVRLDKKNHKTYPAIIPIVLSIKRYVAFFPTVSLPNPSHHPFLIAFNKICLPIKKCAVLVLNFLLRYYLSDL
jgi:hypothetical protein